MTPARATLLGRTDARMCACLCGARALGPITRAPGPGGRLFASAPLFRATLPSIAFHFSGEILGHHAA